MVISQEEWEALPIHMAGLLKMKLGNQVQRSNIFRIKIYFFSEKEIQRLVENAKAKEETRRGSKTSK